MTGPATVLESTISGNLARFGDGGTGSNGNPFASDGAGYGGGIHVAGAGDLELLRSTVNGNDTLGGVAVESEGLTLSLAQQINDWTIGIAYGYREDDIGAATDTESLRSTVDL